MLKVNSIMFRLFGLLEIVLSGFKGNYCLHRLSLKKLSFKWFQYYSILNLFFYSERLLTVLKLISKNTTFENQYFFQNWMNGSTLYWLLYWQNFIKETIILSRNTCIIEIKTIPERKLQNGEEFCALKAMWKS